MPIQTWIENCAPFSASSMDSLCATGGAGCKTDGLSYATDIDPIVARACATSSCHGGALTPKLSASDPQANYAAVGGANAAMQTGGIGGWASNPTTHAGGVVPALMGCDLLQLKAWLMAGAMP